MDQKRSYMMQNISSDKEVLRLSQDSASKTSEHLSSFVKWDDVPHWQQDNHYIYGGYRRRSGSYRGSFASLFSIHNETINIYTHLIPALASLPCAVGLYKVLQVRHGQASQSDLMAFSCFFLGTTLCLGMSATYHTISNHSPRVNQVGNQLDYIGIVLLITGSFVPSIYYGFWCDRHLRMIYWAMVGARPTTMLTTMWTRRLTRGRYAPWEQAALPFRSCRNSARQPGDRSERACLCRWVCPPSFRCSMV